MHNFSAILCTVMISICTHSAVFAQTLTVSGECVGVKIYTDGLIVTDTATLTQTDGKKINIASGYGIKQGDIITKANGKEVHDAKGISDTLEKGDITLTILRNGDEFDVTVTPVQTKDGAKLGLWLRDSTAGLGTLTCIDENNRFIGLGHGICDIDTGNIMPVKYGIIQNCSQFSIIKGEKGSPGAITGNIDGARLGEVISNGPHGISGKISRQNGPSMETADKSEIKTGDATILCNVDGDGVKSYSVRIVRILPAQPDGKDMIIKVTDKDLIAKTGGIIQGMSGSPIIQSGKLIGAVTHVFVNNPTKGYGVFIENMINQN